MKYLLMVAALLFAGCVATVEPVGVGVYAPAPVYVAPAVVVEPFPFVWIGPGYYGGSYYGGPDGRSHGDHGQHGHR
jgi:hypothetical protein